MINGKRLRDDREQRRLSREALLAEFEAKLGHTISLSTLRRAEDGNASNKTASDIAAVLGFPAHRYIITSSQDSTWRSAYDLNGEWIAYYLEDDVGTGIYTVAERLYVEQNGPNLTGVYEPHVTTHPEGYQGPGSFIMKGHVVQNVIFGEYYIEGHALPRGFGVFQLMLLRNGDWAEGFCNFFADDNKIMGSPNIWIRKDSHQLELMRKHAEEYLKLNPTLLKAPFTV